MYWSCWQQTGCVYINSNADQGIKTDASMVENCCVTVFANTNCVNVVPSVAMNDAVSKVTVDESVWKDNGATMVTEFVSDMVTD